MRVHNSDDSEEEKDPESDNEEHNSSNCSSHEVDLVDSTDSFSPIVLVKQVNEICQDEDFEIINL